MDVKGLINRFFSGASDSKEEDSLRNISDDPDSLDAEIYFNFLQEVNNSNPFADDSNIKIDINEITKFSNVNKYLLLRRVFIAVAASVVIALSVTYFLPNNSIDVDNYYVSNSGKTEQEALELAKDILNIFSDSFNKSTSSLQYLSLLGESTKPFEKFGVIVDFSEKLEKVNYINFDFDNSKKY
ncbi:MAG: hypothetical protein JXA53_10665 [Bacteroidales bacterium]|nr:hypothetical protein [Bacteroidales bacterium]